MRTPSPRPANAITEGVIWKQLLSFFFPILLGTFFQQLYNTADAIIVGKFVGKEALAAVGGSTATLANLLVGFFVGLSSGATVIISQYYGARKPEEVSRTVHTAAALTLVGGMLIMVVGLLFSPTILQWMGTPADVLPGAITYLRIYFCGMIPSLVYNIGTGVLRAVGGIDNLIDWENKSQEITNMRYMEDKIAKEDKVFEDPMLMKTPVVRNGKEATVDFRPDVWETWK